MAHINKTSKLGVGKNIFKTFQQFIGETPIGNLPSQTFRPSEAEKLVLLNIDDLISQNRSVTQQDAINVPQEKLDDEELNKDQLEAAFKQLITAKLIEIQPDETIVITAEGQPVVEEAKKAEQQKAEQDQKNQPQPDMGMGDMGMPSGPDGAFGAGSSPNTPMEGLRLVRYVNEMSKLI